MLDAIFSNNSKLHKTKQKKNKLKTDFCCNEFTMIVRIGDKMQVIASKSQRLS